MCEVLYCVFTNMIRSWHCTIVDTCMWHVIFLTQHNTTQRQLSLISYAASVLTSIHVIMFLIPSKIVLSYCVVEDMIIYSFKKCVDLSFQPWMFLSFPILNNPWTWVFHVIHICTIIYSVMCISVWLFAVFYNLFCIFRFLSKAVLLLCNPWNAFNVFHFMLRLLKASVW